MSILQKLRDERTAETDAMLAKFQADREALIAQYKAERAAAASAAAPVAAPKTAKFTLSEDPQYAALNAAKQGAASTVFANEYLPSIGVDLDTFYSLSTAGRKAITDKYAEQRAAALQLNPFDTARFNDAVHKEITYVDFGGKPPDHSTFHTAGNIEFFGPIIVLLPLILLILAIVPLWRICTRAGFNGALSLLTLIPWLGMVIVGAILSFGYWPTKANSVKEQ